MSGRGPDPKDLRASVVDSGWSVEPPPVEPVQLVPAANARSGEDGSTRRLPNYEDLAQAPAVTQIDADIQARLRAMTRASLTDSRIPPLPPPPPARASRPAPSLPPPPPPLAAPRRPSQVPLPSFAGAPAPDTERRIPAYSPLQTSDSELAEATDVLERGAVLPPSDPPVLDALPAPVLSQAPPPGLSQAPFRAEPQAPWPAFAQAPSLPPAAPSLLAVLGQRVRFAGGEVPLWSLLTPMVLLLALGSAFAAAALGAGEERATMSAPSASAVALPPPIPSSIPSTVDVAPESPKTTQAPALPASGIDTEALEARRAEELTKDEALALAGARRLREVQRIVLLRQKLTRDPGLFKDATTLSELRRAAEDPLTAPEALGAMAEAPGTLSADLLYEVWTGTVVRNSATELARSLVFSKEVRAKASPALGVALDLRIAETCEQNRGLLPKVTEQGDRRSLALLAKLARKFGCGPTKRLDCYACLRENPTLVDEAMAAVKKRREPKPFLGK